MVERFARLAKSETLPTAAAAEWAAAKSDRKGNRQLTFCRLYLKDPTWGSLRVMESMETAEVFSNTTSWAWEDEDQLNVRYGYLGAEERIAKVQAEMASATKKTKHPVKKGEFIYRFWRGSLESDSSASSKRRAVQLDAELDAEQANLVVPAMLHDVACLVARFASFVQSQDPLQPCPKLFRFRFVSQIKFRSNRAKHCDICLRFVSQGPSFC